MWRSLEADTFLPIQILGHMSYIWSIVRCCHRLGLWRLPCKAPDWCYHQWPTATTWWLDILLSLSGFLTTQQSLVLKINAGSGPATKVMVSALFGCPEEQWSPHTTNMGYITSVQCVDLTISRSSRDLWAASFCFAGNIWTNFLFPGLQMASHGLTSVEYHLIWGGKLCTWKNLFRCLFLGELNLISNGLFLFLIIVWVNANSTWHTHFRRKQEWLWNHEPTHF